MKVELELKQYIRSWGEVIGLYEHLVISLELTEEQNTVLREVLKKGDISIKAITMVPNKGEPYIHKILDNT